jgi:hypothetical protein
VPPPAARPRYWVQLCCESAFQQALKGYKCNLLIITSRMDVKDIIKEFGRRPDVIAHHYALVNA